MRFLILLFPLLVSCALLRPKGGWVAVAPEGVDEATNRKNWATCRMESMKVRESEQHAYYLICMDKLGYMKKWDENAEGSL